MVAYREKYITCLGPDPEVDHSRIETDEGPEPWFGLSVDILIFFVPLRLIGIIFSLALQLTKRNTRPLKILNFLQWSAESQLFVKDK